tara:strand:+ start:152 stop:514 length:363 start_codon:yes stop_codon:yes gene_type:complete
MALRKTNQKDYEKFANPNKDVLGKEKDPPKVAGEHTGRIRTDKSGIEYSIVGEGDPDFETISTVSKGDTIRPPVDSMFGGQVSNFGQTVDGMIPGGGDYDLTETKNSKKRPNGPRTYNIN